MEGEPASPRSKLLEQIYVRGSDTVIRISDDAVIVKTTREGGIRLPDDLEHPKDAATPVVQATSEDTTSHDAITGEGASGYTASSSGRLKLLVISNSRSFSCSSSSAWLVSDKSTRFTY